MGHKGQPARPPHRLQQTRQIIRQGGQLFAGAEHHQMVLLRLAGLVMDFFAHQQQRLAAAVPVIIFRAVHINIVVGDDHRIQAGPQGRRGDIGMAAVPIRIDGVHV